MLSLIWALVPSQFKLAGLAGLGIVVWFAYGTVQSVIDRYSNMASQNESLSHTNSLLTSRLASYNLRIERRDEAIQASKCAVQIDHWVHHPDEIPKPFSPFNQLN